MPLTPMGPGRRGSEEKILLRKPGDLPTLWFCAPADGVFRDGSESAHRLRTSHRNFRRQFMGRAMAATLHVCITCRAGQELAEGEPRPGRLLHDAVLRAHTGQSDDRLEVREVMCLAACDRGCSAALTAPGKWSYLLGRLSLHHAADLLTYGALYAAHDTGKVLPSQRPASLRDSVLGRTPVLALPEPQT